MIFFSFLTILLVFHLLVGGVLLQILGLVRKKPKLWIPGIIISSIIGLLVMSGIIFTIIKDNAWRMKPYGEYYQNPNLYDNPAPEYEEIAPSETDSVSNILNTQAVTGYVKDANKNSVLIKVYPDNYMELHGIRILSIGDTKFAKKEEAVAVGLAFNKDFKGRIRLQFYNSKNIELSYDVLDVSQEEGSQLELEFLTGNNLHFSDIDYCIITAARY
jgi:hypothetical protein